MRPGSAPGAAACTWLLVAAAATPGAAVQPPAPEEAHARTYRRLADEVEAVLQRDVLGVWFPRSVDTENGGFRERFTRDWRSAGDGEKFSVFQGRMTWLAAQVALRRPELRDEYLSRTRHGLAFLRDVLWDREHGGFYWGLGEDGRISERYGDGKHLYGISFCIYGAAAAYQATGDPEALDLARRGFLWIEQHAHDDEYGGYLEALERDGTPRDPDRDDRRANPFPPGYKSMNTHIHLLEALTQLFEVWQDARVRTRLAELHEIVRDRVAVEPGALHLYFRRDWRPVPDHDSYGHDVETAYLLLEAAGALGRPDDPKTLRVARSLVDHGLAVGWDRDRGGFLREGTTFRGEDPRKEWWVQFEGLNALLLMHELYGRETGAYFEAFVQQWRFIREHQLDAEQRGVYAMIGPGGDPGQPSKSGPWKAGYHDGRALLNVSDRLRALAAREEP